jgi:lipoprotein-anchoring transpeptidase ErfK/SrfK
MPRSIFVGFAVVLLCGAAQTGLHAQQVTPRMVVVAQPQRMQTDMGGGFIEYVFGDSRPQPQYAPQPQYFAPPQYGATRNAAPRYAAPPPAYYGAPAQAPPDRPLYASTGPIIDPNLEPRNYPIDPIYQRQEVGYVGPESPGTIVIDTDHKFLYLIEPDGKALRYGVGVGRPGFTWAGVHKVSAKKEWPDWTPPKEMLERQPGLPHFMPGGPNNPLGARALYLGSTLYRIHGSNEPWTIGHNVSSGCIRLRNADVIDLYNRVKVGAKVVVL